MEVNRYPTMDDLVSLIAKIADNQDKMLEIMTMDPEDDRSVLNAWYGKMVMDEVQKKFWTANEIGKKDDEIQDLKLENDRLKRRNELMEDYIHAVACITSKKSKFKGICDDVFCPYYDHDKGLYQGSCQLGSRQLIEKEAADLIDKLEDL